MRRSGFLGLAALSLVPVPPIDADGQRWYGYRCAQCGRPHHWNDVLGKCRQCDGRIEVIERPAAA